MTTAPEPAFPKGIGASATRALTAAGYAELSQLAGVSEAELEKLHGVGPKALRVIRAALEEQGGSRTKEGAWSAVDSALNPTEGDT
jgi:predicted flap endonuclease-1-like 5' DNA nuclease